MPKRVADESERRLKHKPAKRSRAGKDERSTEVFGEVFAATANWRQVAAGNGIAKREMNRMADAFDGLRAAVG
ncbi:hypothetical protein ACFU7D_10725 [Nocardioides sp. NPDC057577]|uniref:hypothetical protein n=1 Tax=Nocardioides sp. NPDC057577 TaxID=3346171 RepID=UPI00366C8239